MGLLHLALERTQHHLENHFSSTEVINSRAKIRCDQCGAARAVNDSSHILNAAPRGAFQSFFRQVSDTEDLADAVRQLGEKWRYSQGL